MNPISLLIRVVTALLAWLPLQCVRFLRSRMLRKKPVVKLVLGGPEAKLGSKEQMKLFRTLDRLASDEELRAVLVELKGLSIGYATIQQIRSALHRVQEKGKLVLFQLDAAGLKELYLSSLGDRIWVSPMAELHLAGIGATIPFYGDGLSRLGVRVELLSAGAYKSFGEPYSRAWPTTENREQLESLLGDLQEQVVESIASSRQRTCAQVEDALGASPISASDALSRGLVDGVAYADEVVDQIKELLDIDTSPLSLKPYRILTAVVVRLRRMGRRRESIPVVHLRGPVVMSEAEGGSGPKIAAERVVPFLERLAEDEDCKTVVLAVDSPGGTALASDLIARAITRLMKDRPVVAWFGDVSASGGYYISAPTSEIIANPGTITGSIGVVGGKIVLGDAVARAGIQHTTISAGPDTTMLGPWDAFTRDQRQRFRQSLIRVYDRFLSVVASGREMSNESVLSVAEGRVWTGRQALERGLVDHLGGLDFALDRARILAEMDEKPREVEHIRFKPSRLRALQSMSRSQVGGPQIWLDELRRRTGGVLFGAVWSHPLEPLMVMPWELDNFRDS